LDLDPARQPTPSAACDVHPKSGESKLLAALAFHEAIHNKLATGNSMHTNADGLAQAVVNENTTVSAANAAKMAAAFRKPVVQWPTGVGIGLARKARRDSGDPLWNLPHVDEAKTKMVRRED
jgi:hypothetical protein